jgi:hypothetical protein
VTVSRRRSGKTLEAEGACCAPTAAPQSPQNHLSGAFSLPQALHRQGSCDPQSPQNFLLSRTVAPQRGQIMRSPSFGRQASPFVVTKTSVHKPQKRRNAINPCVGESRGNGLSLRRHNVRCPLLQIRLLPNPVHLL